MKWPFVSRRTYERERRAARLEGESAPLSNLMMIQGRYAPLRL